MSYYRVIPRDLFNEAKLLKCLGRIYIEGERYMPNIELRHDGEPFEIEQNPNDGSIYVANVELIINGKTIHVFTTLNAKDAYPMLADIDEESVHVFTEEGYFTSQFLEVIQGSTVS